MPAEPLIGWSAHKHGVGQQDILHAYRMAVRRIELDEGMTLLIGPTWSGELLEIGVVTSPSGSLIVNAMKARRKFLR